MILDVRMKSPETDKIFFPVIHYFKIKFSNYPISFLKAGRFVVLFYTKKYITVLIN